MGSWACAWFFYYYYRDVVRDFFTPNVCVCCTIIVWASGLRRLDQCAVMQAVSYNMMLHNHLTPKNSAVNHMSSMTAAAQQIPMIPIYLHLKS